jgi:hypothetical protein
LDKILVLNQFSNKENINCGVVYFGGGTKELYTHKCLVLLVAYLKHDLKFRSIDDKLKEIFSPCSQRSLYGVIQIVKTLCKDEINRFNKSRMTKSKALV